ncbi:MAG: hypothetical protein RR501_06085 [Cloacibacillus sp.]
MRHILTSIYPHPIVFLGRAAHLIYINCTGWRRHSKQDSKTVVTLVYY